MSSDQNEINQRTVCIHQPNLFPWIGFFHKVFESDVFVSLDDVQFARNSFTRRVNIRSNEKSEDTAYLILPLQKHHQLTNINQLYVDHTQLWQVRLLNQIKNTYCNAPNFNFFFETLEFWLEESKSYARLDEINFFLLQKMFAYLDIQPKEIYKSSELNLSGFSSSDYILEICKKLNATTYLSGIGSKNYLVRADFEKNNITLRFVDFAKWHARYPIAQQQGKKYLGGLSIIDALMNISAEEVVQHLENFKKISLFEEC